MSRTAGRTVGAAVRDLTSHITSAQRGLITRHQAIGAGMTDSAIGHLVRRGIWRRVRNGLYALNGIPSDWELEVLGAVLLAGSPAWASHYSSARLWDYRGLADGPIEITTLLERRMRVGGIRCHRSGTLHEDDLRVVDGIPTLSAARTIVDLSARLTEAALDRMIDDGLRRRVLTIGELRSVARRLPTIAPGRSPKTIESILHRRLDDLGPTDSELESRVLQLLVDAGLPRPVLQHRVVLDGRTYFIDLAYPEPRLAIEVDGYGFHGDRTTFDRDRRRQNDLVNAGWTVLRFTSRSTDDEILEAVRRALFGRSLVV